MVQSWIRSCLTRWLIDEKGSGTILALFLVLISLTIGGLAIDFNQAMARRTHLQVTSDAVAHAALYTRESASREDAISKALQIAAVNLPSDRNGDALLASDIEFGVWDPDTRTFTPDPGSKTAVRVSAHRLLERGNAVHHNLLRMIGFDTIDLNRSAVYVTYQPTCFKEGFVAEKLVDVQSNNSFQNGFCIHSNDHVKVSSNNFFGEDTIVSMPDTDHLQMPKSGFDTNAGLEKALRDNRYHSRMLNQLDRLISDLEYNAQNIRPSYISTPLMETLDGKDVDGSQFEPGKSYKVTCSGGGSMKIQNGSVIRDTVVVTDCPITFGQGSTLENAVFATTNTDVKSIIPCSPQNPKFLVCDDPEVV